MNKSILTFLILLFSIVNGVSQLSKSEYENVVRHFIDCIRTSNLEELDKIISYPYVRSYPIPPINNKQELKQRYSEIFDDSLTSIIINSDIKEDWTDMGWRGIMLNNGIVWLDYDGKLLATNYSSEKEKILKQKLIEYERDLLHADLKDFKEPVHTIETSKFIVRIDLLENQEYRYASWSKGSELSNKPDLIISNGEWTPDGSGGNHHYTFTNGQFNYIVFVNNLGMEETTPFDLVVSKGDKILLNQPAELKELR